MWQYGWRCTTRAVCRVPVMDRVHASSVRRFAPELYLIYTWARPCPPQARPDTSSDRAPLITPGRRPKALRNGKWWRRVGGPVRAGSRHRYGPRRATGPWRQGTVSVQAFCSDVLVANQSWSRSLLLPGTPRPRMRVFMCACVLCL
jgi:hypothetical protein